MSLAIVSGSKNPTLNPQPDSFRGTVVRTTQWTSRSGVLGDYECTAWRLIYRLRSKCSGSASATSTAIRQTHRKTKSNKNGLDSKEFVRPVGDDIDLGKLKG